MWLLEQSVFSILRECANNKIEITSDLRAEYEALTDARTQSSTRILDVVDGTAQIDVMGVISNKPDIFAMLFGGGNVLWSEIIEAVAVAEADDSVNEIVLNVDSPGGAVDGMFDAIAAVSSAKKPVTALVNNVAASAAFGLASQADEIVAKNKAARIGSVGVVASFAVDDDVVRITSTEAPNKAPDVTTEDGQDIIREELDALHELFVDAIASGRSRASGSDITVKAVNENFGQGSVFLAEKALSKGMIDSILDGGMLRSEELSNTISATNLSHITTGTDMDLKTLKRDHSDVYEAVLAEGVAQERDRVVAHLTMGNASGAIETAIKAVEDGSGLSESLKAKYLSAGMNRAEVFARGDDEEDTSDALNNLAAKVPEEGMAEQVAALVEAKMGVA
jgi:ClpP class serine protease